jgi:hypothetical protein
MEKLCVKAVIPYLHKKGLAHKDIHTYIVSLETKAKRVPSFPAV